MIDHGSERRAVLILLPRATSLGLGVVWAFPERGTGELKGGLSVAKRKADKDAATDEAVAPEEQVEEQAGEQAGEKLKSQALNVQESESDPTRVTQLATFLASGASDGLTGRLISAIWDEWESFTTEKIHEIVEKDWYQLRRTVPPS